MKSKFFLIVAVMMALCPVAINAKKFSKYLFVYFPSNDNENIYYALSDKDTPFDFVPMNDGKMVVSADTIALKKGVRDPHILRGNDGWFYMVNTDMRCAEGWASNRGMVLMRSKDLVNWQHHTVHFPDRYKGTMFEHVTRVWAPQTFYDKRTGKYIVYFSILTDDGSCPYDRVYWAYANKDFSDLEGEPQLLFDMKNASIDTDIVQDDEGLLHIFFKTEGSRQKGIKQFIAKDFYNGNTWELQPGWCQDTNKAVEGAGVFRLHDGTWVLMYDCYTSGHYQFCKSTDLKTFKQVQDTKTEGAFTPRHGTVIGITAKELKRLEKAFPNN